MISVDEVYKDVQLLANKAQYTGYISPSEFNRFAKMASDWRFMSLYGNPEEYRPGAPMPRKSYPLTQKIKDDLRHFVKKTTLTVDRWGKASYPGDYIHLDSCNYLYIPESDCEDCEPGYVPPHEVTDVDNVDQIALGHRLRSRIVNPTLKHPILVQYDEYIQFYPKNLGSVQFTYLRHPESPVWGYTITDGRPVYDPGTSIDFDWPPQVKNQLVFKILSLFGIQVREQELLSTTEGLGDKGQ